MRVYSPLMSVKFASIPRLSRMAALLNLGDEKRNGHLFVFIRVIRG
jgi:hypothetical protein